MRYEALRLLCFFDLPMESKDEKRIYRNFRKELISNGFEMLQFRSTIALVLIEALQINFIRS